VANAVDAGNFVLFGPRDVNFLRNIKELKADVVHTGKRVKKLFALSVSDSYIEKMSNNDSSHLWHARLGHLNMDKLKDMVKLKLVNGCLICQVLVEVKCVKVVNLGKHIDFLLTNPQVDVRLR